MTQLPTQEERLTAEEVEVAETSTPEPELFDDEISYAMVNSIAANPVAMTNLVRHLFSHPEFKEFLAASFAHIYNTYVTIANQAASDFENTFEIQILDSTSGNPTEFHLKLAENDKVMFFNILEDGSHKSYNEPNQGVQKIALKALKDAGAEAGDGKTYIALLVPKAIPAAEEVTEQQASESVH